MFLSTAATPALGTLTPLTTYAGNAPSSVTFDWRTQNRFFVTDQTDLYSSTNAGVSFNTLTANLTALNITSPTTVAFISNNGVNELLVGGLDSVANTPSTIAVADSDSAGNLTNFRLFGTGLPNTYVTALSYDVKSDALAVGLFGRGGWVEYDVTGNFASATVLRFGRANNNSNPDVSLLTGARPLVKFGTGTLTLTGAASYTGGSIISAGLTQIGSGTTAGSVVGTITFAGSSVGLGIANDIGFSNTISGLHVGVGGARSTFVDIEGHTVTVSRTTGNTTTGGTITLSDGVVLQVTNFTAPNWFANTVSDGAGGTDVFVSDTPCFCRGTMILSERGEVPVENLEVGDRIKTLSGNVKPIVWIGYGRDLVTRANKLARPIIVRRGALADGVPHRDLYLTHGHALYLDGALIPVENLVNHRSILWDETARVVEYYHVELEGHDVVLADGAPAETYYDANNRAQFQNARLGSKAGNVKLTFAPVVNSGEVVEQAWMRLFERSGGRIRTDTTGDPDLPSGRKGYSWTDGELALPAGLFAHLEGRFTLTVSAERPGMRYPITEPLTQAA